MNHYNIQVVVPTSSPPLQTLYSPCVCGWSSVPDVEEAGGSGGQQRGSRWKKWENVREKFPSCPHLTQSCACLGLYNENGSEKKPNGGGTSFVMLSRRGHV